MFTFIFMFMFMFMLHEHEYVPVLGPGPGRGREHGHGHCSAWYVCTTVLYLCPYLCLPFSLSSISLCLFPSVSLSVILHLRRPLCFFPAPCVSLLSLSFCSFCVVYPILVVLPFVSPMSPPISLNILISYSLSLALSLLRSFSPLRLFRSVCSYVSFSCCLFSPSMSPFLKVHPCQSALRLSISSPLSLPIYHTPSFLFNFSLPFFLSPQSLPISLSSVSNLSLSSVSLPSAPPSPICVSFCLPVCLLSVPSPLCVSHSVPLPSVSQRWVMTQPCITKRSVMTCPCMMAVKYNSPLFCPAERF
jgi:hypothetical protein